MTEPYTYAILRYFHDIATGECVNVGVAVFAPKSRFLQIRCAATGERAARMFPDLNRKAFEAALRAIEAGFLALRTRISASLPLSYETSTIAEFAKSVLPTDDSALKWASFGSGITNDPKQELDNLFQRMVQRYEQTGSALGGSSDIATIFGKITEGFAERLVPSVELGSGYQLYGAPLFGLTPNNATANVLSTGDCMALAQGSLGMLVNLPLSPNYTYATGTLSAKPSTEIKPDLRQPLGSMAFFKQS